MLSVITHKTQYFFGGAAKMWWFFILAGTFAFSSQFIFEMEVSALKSTLVGFALLFIGLILKVHHQGLQIDFKSDKIRNYTSIMGIKTGQWHSLSHIKKITLTSKNVSSWNTPNGISPTFRNDYAIYTLALFSDREDPDYFIQTESKIDAEKKAKTLSEILAISLDRQ